MRNVNQRTQALIIGAHLLLASFVLVSVTVLAVLERPISAFVASIFTAIVVLAGGSVTAASVLGTALNGKSVVSPQLLANQQQIIRESAHLLAGQAPVSTTELERTNGETLPPLSGSGQE